MFDQVANSLNSFLPALEGKGKHDFTVVIDGTPIPVIRGELLRSINTCADGANVDIELNEQTRELIRPYGYQHSQVFLGNELVLTGRLYDVAVQISDKGKRAVLDIFSYAVDIVDSTVYPPLEFNFVTLSDLAKDLVPEDIDVVFEANSGNEHFDRATADPQQKKYEFLQELAEQRGVLINSNEEGKLVFTRANTTGQPVAQLDVSTEIGAKFVGRERFHSYKTQAVSPVRRCITKKLKTKVRTTYKTVQTKKIAIAYDFAVPDSRQTTFHAYNVSIDGIQDAANWQRSKALVKALSIEIPVTGWYPYDDEVTLLTKNTLVTLISDDLWIPNGFDFLVKSVKYNLDDSGATALLSLVPPQVYTGEDLPDIFGAGAGVENLLKSLSI